MLPGRPEFLQHRRFGPCDISAFRGAVLSHCSPDCLPERVRLSGWLRDLFRKTNPPIFSVTVLILCVSPKRSRTFKASLALLAASLTSAGTPLSPMQTRLLPLITRISHARVAPNRPTPSRRTSFQIPVFWPQSTAQSPPPVARRLLVSALPGFRSCGIVLISSLDAMADGQNVTTVAQTAVAGEFSVNTTTSASASFKPITITGALLFTISSMFALLI